MPQSLAKVLIHMVWSTKHRTPFLKDKGVRRELYAYMATVLQTMDSPVIIINGVDDHVHVLCLMSRKFTLAQLFEAVKADSSKWIKTKGAAYREFYWQSGYGVFSVSESNCPEVKEYIADQEEHHRKMSYQDEFRWLCKKHGVEIDERYVWD
ncbi:MAG: IS200/IS605 family transposase [Pirellulaceae bacterium]